MQVIIHIQIGIFRIYFLTDVLVWVIGVSAVLAASARVAPTGEPNMIQIGVKALISILTQTVALSLLETELLFIWQC